MATMGGAVVNALDALWHLEALAIEDHDVSGFHEVPDTSCVNLPRYFLFGIGIWRALWLQHAKRAERRMHGPANGRLGARSVKQRLGQFEMRPVDEGALCRASLPAPTAPAAPGSR
jgi:hypothetical protein